MKKLLLPETAFKCEGPEVVFNQVFTDGELIVSDDVAEQIAPALVGFYGVTVEDIEEIASAPNDPTPSLASNQTKK